MTKIKRTKSSDLTTWLRDTGRKPLVIRGARQVGKSTLVREFALQEGRRLYEINLEKHRGLEKVFASLDVKNILAEIQFILQREPINPQTDILFIDEIQSIPVALQALRYFYEDMPELPVIAAGSLLEFVLSEHTFSMPVGRVNYLFLGPVTFNEYLGALDQHDLVESIQNYSSEQYFPEAAHDRLMNHLRDFIVIGGMPEATAKYIETKDIIKVNLVHSSIIETYKNDFSKYQSKVSPEILERLFIKSPLIIGKKIKYSTIDKELKAKDIKSALFCLQKAQIIQLAYHSHASHIPIGAEVEEKIVKFFFLDVGLLCFMSGIRTISLDELKTDELNNKGKIAEQFIAQHLLSFNHSFSTPQLYYWLREGKKSNAEVDFIIQHNQKIIPVEVKSGSAGALKSLFVFCEEKNSKLAVRFDSCMPSIQSVRHAPMVKSNLIEFDLRSFPLYFVETLPALLMSK